MKFSLDSKFSNFAQEHLAEGAVQIHDCVLKAEDETAIPATRFVLGAYSQFFKALFGYSKKYLILSVGANLHSDCSVFC
jgi:hypothetical protein